MVVSLLNSINNGSRNIADNAIAVAPAGGAGDLDATDPCEDARESCIVSVTAQAVVMTLGCAALDLTVAAGIVCHAAVLVYENSACANCNATAASCEQQN